MNKKLVGAKNLDRKFYEVREAGFDFTGRQEDLNQILTALLREQQLRLRHTSVSQAKRPFLFDPYSLLVYKKGLYVAGFCHHHQRVRITALDGLREVKWLRGESFEYPDDYRPEQLVEGTFGLISGPKANVRIFFDRTVSRYVRRRRWHPTQKIRNVTGGIELAMEVQGTIELTNWILSYGEHAEVLEPAELREEMAGKLERAAARYRG